MMQIQVTTRNLEDIVYFTACCKFHVKSALAWNIRIVIVQLAPFFHLGFA